MLHLALAACLSLQLHYVSGWALPWLVTEYVEIHLSTIITATTYTAITRTQSELVDTDIVTVSPTATPISTLSVVTTVDRYNSDLTLVEILLPTGAGASISREYVANPTTYYVQIVYTAPSSCPSPGWTYTKAAMVNAPRLVTFEPTAVSVVTTVPYAFAATSTDIQAFVDPTDIPPSELSSISSVYAPYFTRSCSIPDYYTRTGTARPTTTSYSGGSGSSSDSDPRENDFAGCDPFVWYALGTEIGRGYICSSGVYYTHGMSIATFVVVWIFSWFGLFLILGLIESYVNFSNLSRGRKARRGMPCLFAGLMPFLSCFCLCFRKPGFAAKSPEEQRLLEEQWNATPVLTRISRWVKWGFRFKYPPFLGDAPARRKNWGDKDAKPKEGDLQHTTGAEAVVTYPVAELDQQPKYELPGPEVIHVDQKAAYTVVDRV